MINMGTRHMIKTCTLFAFLIGSTVLLQTLRSVRKPLSEVGEIDNVLFGAKVKDRHLLSTDGDSDDNNLECRDVHDDGVTDKCNFTKTLDDCQPDDGFINYISFAYCSFGQHAVGAGVAILFFWWLFLFIGLAVTADDFFCPSLTVIAKTLRMSHNIAGVTLLAFGNGAPDVFSAIAAIGNAKSGDAGLAFGALLGAGVFVSTVVAGTIAIVTPFEAMKRPFLRDVIFFLGSVFWTFKVLYYKSIKTLEAVGFLLMYLVYVVVVVVGRFIHQKHKNTRSKEQVIRDAPSIQQAAGTEDGTLPSITQGITAGLAYAETNGRARSPCPNHPEPRPYKAVKDVARIAEDITVAGVMGHDVEEIPQLKPQVSVPGHLGEQGSNNEMTPLLGGSKEEPSVIRDFLSAIKPINTEDWGDMRWYARIYEVFKSPFLFILIITVPVVDYDNDNKHNWNRLLQVLQCVTAPVFCSLATKGAFTTLGDFFPVGILVAILGIVLAVVVFATTKHEEPPIYHWAFAYMGFVTAVIWIYSIANEIVNLLQMFGVVFNISNAVLGLTLLAWGNSLGDFIADMVMARQGFPRMGISACFGGPLFNILLGVGIPFTIGCIKKGGEYKIKFTFLQIILAGFCTLSLVSSLIVIPLMKFRFTRAYGIYLICMYGVFLLTAILVETNVIHVDV